MKTPTKRSVRNLLILVFIVTLLTHITYLANDFTGLDHGDIEANRAVVPLTQLPRSFLTRFGETNFYRPLVIALNSLDASLYGKWAPGFHLTNLILHLLVLGASWLFLAAFWQFKPQEKAWVLLIIGVHPLSALIVGSIIMRQESLLIIFSWLSVYGYALARNRGRLKFALLSVITLALALFTKETALVLIPSLIIIWEGQAKLSLKKNTRVWWGQLVVVLIYVFIRWRAVPNLWTVKIANLSLGENIGLRIGLLGKMAIELVSPFKPSFSDVTPVLDLQNFGVILTLVGVALIAIVILRLGLRDPLSRALLVTLVLLAPGLNIVPVPRIGSPHYSYLAVIGVAVIIVLLLSKLRKFIRQLAMAGLLAWVIMASLTTFKTGFQFRDDFHFFTPEVQQDPNFLEGHYFLGNYYFKTGDYQQADREYQLALGNQPHLLTFVDKHSLYINYAGVKLAQKDYQSAEELLSKAVVISDYQHPLVVYNLALVAANQGNYQAAVERLLKYSQPWDRPEPPLLLVKSYFELKKYREAAEVLERNQHLFDEPQRAEMQKIFSELTKEQSK